MKSEKSSPLGLYTVGIAALFLAGFLLLVIFGAQNYRNTVKGQSDNMSERALLSYLSTTLKAYDSSGAVSVYEDGGRQILSVADGDTGYALRIYLSGGKLVEDYAPLDAKPDSDNAQIIGECSSFSVEMLGESLMRIRTDAGQVLIKLRSEGGADT